MAVFNPVLRMETGLLVSGEEYMGFLPEKLDTVSGEMSSISFRPGTCLLYTSAAHRYGLMGKKSRKLG